MQNQSHRKKPKKSIQRLFAHLNFLKPPAPAFLRSHYTSSVNFFFLIMHENHTPSRQMIVPMGVNGQWALYPKRQALPVDVTGINVEIVANVNTTVSPSKNPYPFFFFFIVVSPAQWRKVESTLRTDYFFFQIMKCLYVSPRCS